MTHGMAEGHGVDAMIEPAPIVAVRHLRVGVVVTGSKRRRYWSLIHCLVPLVHLTIFLLIVNEFIIIHFLNGKSQESNI